MIWAMSFSFYFQVFAVALAGGTLGLLGLPDADRDRWDRRLFWLAACPLFAFVLLRPWGVSLDDFGGYETTLFDAACPTLECGHWLQGKRDTLWYSLVGLLKSIHPSARVQLWLAGSGFLLKLWVIYRLCCHRSLALLAYIALFYLIHDVTALRVSLAIAIYCLGFYWLVRGAYLGWGALLLNGFFHQQAFVAPLLLLERWLPLQPAGMAWKLLLPLALLMIGAYPNDTVLAFISKQSFWNRVFEGYQAHYLGGVEAAAKGAYAKIRTWPVVVPPTLLLAAWLLRDLYPSQEKLFRHVALNLLLAAWFLWGYAAVPVLQLRFWHFFLVPIVFVIGNARLTRWKLVAIYALVAMYVLKYTFMNTLLLEQRRVLIEEAVGGVVELTSPGKPCGLGCGFNVPEGNYVVLKATPEPGYRLAEWLAPCEGVKAECAFVLGGDMVVGARFVRVASLYVKRAGKGTVTALGGMKCGADCEMRVDGGELLVDGEPETVLTARPAPGFRFAGWLGSCEGVAPDCRLSMNQNRTVVARFVTTFTVELEVSQGGRVVSARAGIDCSDHCTASIDSTDDLVVEAIADPGYRFDGWGGDCTGLTLGCGLALNSDKRISARFIRSD